MADSIKLDTSSMWLNGTYSSSGPTITIGGTTTVVGTGSLFWTFTPDPLTEFWKPVISDEDLEALCDKIIEQHDEG